MCVRVCASRFISAPCCEDIRLTNLSLNPEVPTSHLTFVSQDQERLEDSSGSLVLKKLPTQTLLVELRPQVSTQN